MANFIPAAAIAFAFLLSMVLRKDMPAGKSGYYHYNSHGDVVAISDGNGQELNCYEYNTWGKRHRQDGGDVQPVQVTAESCTTRRPGSTICGQGTMIRR